MAPRGARRALFCGIIAALVVAATLVSQSANPPASEASATPARPAAVAGTSPPAVPLAVPAPLAVDGLDLKAGPVAVPIELRLPSLHLSATVLGVGLTPASVMDAPMGRADDPVWQQAFWYRGSAVPGAASTAVLAGHVSDPLGRPGVFGSIDQLRAGDPVVVHDTRSGLDVRFDVTSTSTYSLPEASDPAVLRKIYGDGPVDGTPPQPSADGLSRLTLITCAGTFTKGTHDHRLVVTATRVG